MNNSICIFLHLQCDTGPSHMCRHCKILSPNSSKASTECRLGQASTVLEEKCGKILHCNQRRKKNPISKTSDVMSECRSNMDLAEQLLASLSHKHNLALLCHPSFNAPPLHYHPITWSHSNYNNFSLLHDNSTSVSLRSASHGCVMFA